MAFSSLLSNQMVSHAEAATGGFTLNSGKTNPGGTQMMTKAMAFDMYNLAVTASTNGIADNQLMQKSFWETLTCNLSTMIVGATDTRRGYFSGGTLGTLSNTSASTAETGAVIFGLTFNTDTMALSFAINGSSNTIPPNGWTSLSISGYQWHRTSFTTPYFDGAYWQYLLFLNYNPIAAAGSGIVIGLCKTAYAEDTTPPSAPTNVTSSNITDTSMTITWTASTDNVGVAGYKIYQNGSLVYTASHLETSYYTNTVLTPGVSYSFTVYAIDGNDNVSLVSNTYTASTTGGYYTFTASSTDNLNDATACGYSPNITLYAKVANPVVGTILYTNTACTTAYSASVSRWRKWTGGGNKVMRYGTSIAEILSC